ncbi:MAG: efflux RND transporter periplasmic adaptor subunit [Agitococcus sp.]|nr:efflux RND transporter periplasmic adaptor subunit [Agitococcus sp.]
MKLSKRLVISLVVVVAVAVLSFWGYSTWKKPVDSQRYRTLTLGRGDVAQTVSATGTLNPVRVVSVGTQVSGTVEKLYVDFNSQVKENQVLLELNTDLTQAKLAQSQASLNSANAKLALSQTKAKRMRELFQQQYISRQELDDAEADVVANIAQKAQVQAQVQTDSINVANTVIRSPVSGVVIDRSVDEGQTVAASFQTPTLIKIAQDLTKMQINASFSEADLGKLKTGQTASFRVDAFPNENYQGVVRQIRLNPTTQQNVVTYDVVIDVANPELKLLPGMTAYVDIVLEERSNVLLVPNAALRFKPTIPKDKKAVATNTDTVKTARKGGRSGMAKVYTVVQGELKDIKFKTGISDGKFTEVLGSELKEGTSVVVSDSQSTTAKAAPMRGL